MSDGRFAGKVAVVTGGANGIGRACCERLASEGASVVVADLAVDAGNETVAAIEAAGGAARFIKLDATSHADNDAMAALAVSEFGGLDMVVTAAGISHAGYVSGDLENELKWLGGRLEYAEAPHLAVIDQDIDEFRQVIEVNLIGTLMAIQASVARMVELDRPGAIVTIASIAAKHPDAGPLAYVCSKSAVWMLTKKLARELATAKVRINAIGPGYIETSMTEVITMMPQDDVERFFGQIPLGRRGVPAEIASTAAFLLSDDASYFTGEILHPDGGFFTE